MGQREALCDGRRDPLPLVLHTSPPSDDGIFDLAVTRVEGGAASTFLHSIPVGATVEISEAQGFFTLPDAPSLPLLFVATGTGVAPLRAIARSALSSGTTVPITLLFGVRTEADLLYRDEFESLARTHPGFTFVPTLSRPDTLWAGRRGYVQDSVPAMVASLGGSCDAYVCGLQAMIREVRRVLKIELGLPRQQIHTERYD